MNDENLERACAQFIYREAELLDNRRLDEWLDILSPDVDYRAPVRSTRSSGDDDGFSTSAFYYCEDYGSLKLRVARFASDYAWSENPPTRTRRLVSNLRVAPLVNGDSCIALTTNFAAYCWRGTASYPYVLTGERQDMLQQTNGEMKLRKRLILLDITVLGMESLSIFL